MKIHAVLLVALTSVTAVDAHAASSELSNNTSAKWGEQANADPSSVSNAVRETPAAAAEQAGYRDRTPEERQPEPKPTVARQPLTPALAAAVATAADPEKAPERPWGMITAIAVGVLLLWRWFFR
ncbi:hypothetical protein [Tahibacter amnicola]|uniref:MYXO-CTERM domain-containing protein n=1 Tax=Tahibacter amnicola TaxID=2976241 RepID=A0ABY6BK87_9GAMM|nr:hypothetical protein [Tahibacter amnicola]UXI70275.1 hypothetical protein N4264_11760 [Tahibacter amnicola]